MKFISKIILLSALLFSTLFSNTNIDECKSDLYYANGIMIKESKRDARKIWEIKAEGLFSSNQEAFNKLGKITIAYNASQGFFSDVFESAEQAISNEWGWEEFSGHLISICHYSNRNFSSSCYTYLQKVLT